IIDWWRHHQRSDGQVGGGWNDDTLIFGWRYSYGDLPLDGNADALALYNNVLDGFDRTNYFRDGYCRVWPIDDLHKGDFVRNRAKSLIYNLGDPRSATWAMEEARHWGRPEETPVNYGDGSAFLFGKNVLEWYWNTRRVEAPYVPADRDDLVRRLCTAAYVHSDTTLWRYTEAWCHTDDQYPLGGTIMFDVTCGGIGEIYTRYSQNTRGDDVMARFSVGVGWPVGGGPDLARLVEFSGNDRLTVSLYSFDTVERDVTARLFRLDPGTYHVTLRDDSGRLVRERDISIRRFANVPLLIPPRLPVTLDIRQTSVSPEPAALPDLATSDYYISRDGSSLTVTVHNIGTAAAPACDLTVYDMAGEVLKTVKIPAIAGAADFVPKQAVVKVQGLPERDGYVVKVDSGDEVFEIYEGNNGGKG
ncbi:MAG: hypothetical protein J7M24_00350, partial [Candidatus Latescibacteria bacterium]|nr:hypothetical protein [Candidatus Latescibacterota bacterium]